MRKKQKSDIRLYVDSDYKSYLKLVAEQQEDSLNGLILELLNKKYPFNKKAQKLLKSKVSSDVKNPEVAVKCQDDAGCNILSADDEQVSLETLSPTSSTPVDDVPIERVETQQAEAPQVSPSVDELLSRGGDYTKAEKKILKRRITEINQIIDTAKDTGNHLPKDEFQKLCAEKQKLKLIVYPNNPK